MPIRKASVPEGITQGYAAGQLDADIETLVALNDAGSEDITGTIVGKVCSEVMPKVRGELETLFKRLKKRLPDEVVKSLRKVKLNGDEYEEDVDEVQLHMGPLKKVPRILEKAAHYAICDGNHPTLQLAKVRDILRATMVFPPAAWRADHIGSEFIDVINDHFEGAVVQVKNRFIEDRYPNLKPLASPTLSDDLIEHIRTLFKQTLYGRDTFYRDMALLIRIDNEKFPNQQGMSHTILELQLASSLMYGAKTFKDHNNMSGHDMYKIVRSVMEFCEFLYWQMRYKDESQQVQLQDPNIYYNVTQAQLDNFATSVDTMYNLYRKMGRGDWVRNLRDAIDKSKWYKQLKNGVSVS